MFVLLNLLLEKLSLSDSLILLIMMLGRIVPVEVDLRKIIFFLMKPKILNWNIQSLNYTNKQMGVRRLLHVWKLDIVCLQETKLNSIDRNIINCIWGCSLACNEAFEGILIMWDSRVVKALEECINISMLAHSFKNVIDGFM